MTLTDWLSRNPLIAILRGLTPDEALPVAEVLAEAGFRCLEVPLNSPRALESITRIAREWGDEMLIGAGTVLRPEEARACVAAGGRIVVSPNTDASVIAAGVAAGAICLPGAATPTEAFAALSAGAHGLKLFPAEAASPAVLKAWRAVLPAGTPVIPVGGIAPDTMAAWHAAGAAGFGIGGSLYAPGRGLDDLRRRAQALQGALAEG
ncbi:MAG: 2-dehydro-3-deoxy-6-phosphogalactonate aldolase [Rhodobacteraceae bacterium]|nr:2-dehydro-3-deoxy-6-phosphogalactonate aldolase [Paracoccaceae bacterium]MBR9819821.1 2-dehydro-3-deoxy-6-phosphogalactonate aldolase [Paracoccaceae bacterium]